MENNISHYITVGVVAAMPGLRRFLGLLGLTGLVVGGLLLITPTVTGVNPSPVCDREVFRTLSQVGPPDRWVITSAKTPSGNTEWYVREAHGSGWCRVVHNNTAVVQRDGLYGTLWTEVPSKYGDRVQANADDQHHEMSFRGLMTWIIIGFSLVILLGIWLPATIIAAAGRNVLQNLKE